MWSRFAITHWGSGRTLENENDRYSTLDVCSSVLEDLQLNTLSSGVPLPSSISKMYQISMLDGAKTLSLICYADSRQADKFNNLIQKNKGYHSLIIVTIIHGTMTIFIHRIKFVSVITQIHWTVLKVSLENRNRHKLVGLKEGRFYMTDSSSENGHRLLRIAYVQSQKQTNNLNTIPYRILNQ